MNEKIIEIIRIVGIGTTEILVELKTDSGIFDSIEWNKKKNKLILHVFLEDDMDISFDFESLPEEDQKQIWTQLSSFWN
jgi:hypothetical protein